MKNNGKAYLEDYNIIKVIIHKSINYDDLIIRSYKEKLSLTLLSIEQVDEYYHIYYKTEKEIDFNSDYYVSNKDIDIFVKLGKVTRTIRFDNEFYTNELLGVTIENNITTFKVWSPVAKQVKLVLSNHEFNLKLANHGVWELSINENLDSATYYYKVRIDEEFFDCLDPYAICYSYDFKSCIIKDLNKTIDFDNFVGQADPIIEEISLRDLARSIDVYHIGEINANEIFAYYKNIGINTIQLMPVFGFGDVDEVDYKTSYNWGYNPVLPFAVSNYLTGDEFNGIDILKNFISIIHKEKLSVTFDLVFNHVFDYKTFSYGLLVPGYFYYTDSQGFLTNSSGCGNDFNSNSKMGRKYIVDCCKYMVKTFKLDGIRFDLMGLLDIETMNSIKEELEKINANILLYGEGWDIPNNLKKEDKPIIANSHVLPYISFFNDYYRDNIKRFVSGLTIDTSVIKNCIFGSPNLFNNFRQSINYVECHDDYTFNDYLLLNNSSISDKERIDRIKLSLCINAISLGIPFYSLGEERCRTKGKKSNTYNAGDDINKVLPYNSNEYSQIVNTLKEILNVRKKLEYSRIRDLEYMKDNIDVVKEGSHILFTISDNDIDYYIYIKNNYENELIIIDDDMNILFNECSYANYEIEFNKPSILIISELN